LLQTRSCGVVGPSMRPIATDAQLRGGRSIHAAYCYRRAAVAWSVHPCGLLLQTHSSGVVGPSTRPIATDAQCGVVWQSTRPIATGAVVEQPGGQRAFLVLFSVVTMTVFGISIAHYVLSQQCRDH